MTHPLYLFRKNDKILSLISLRIGFMICLDYDNSGEMHIKKTINGIVIVNVPYQVHG